MRSGNESQPHGVSLGRVLEVPTGIAYDEVRLAIRAIDRVHGVGDLPKTWIRLAPGLNSRGRFRFDDVTGAPAGILVRPDQDHVAFTMVHEVAHYLDLCAFGFAGQFGSAINPILSDWDDAVTESRSFRQLTILAHGGIGRVTEIDGSARLVTLTSRELTVVREWTLPEEAWARSYAQYVANRSRDTVLLSSLEALRARRPGTVYYPAQWDDDDFAPIDAAIDALFRARGWRR